MEGWTLEADSSTAWESKTSPEVWNAEPTTFIFASGFSQRREQPCWQPLRLYEPVYWEQMRLAIA